MSSTVDEEVVSEIIDQVWESLLQSEATPWYGEANDGERTVCAQVSLHGDWNGLVRLTCARDTAERLAAAMLGVDAQDQLPVEDVHDVVSEIVNIVGGNVKGALAGTSALGLPEVTPHAESPHTVPTNRYVVDWQGSPVVFEVFTDD